MDDQKIKQEKNVVGDYLFQSPKQAERAKKEQDYIRKLKRSMNPEDVENMYQLYLKLTSKGYFHTPVGFGFLDELRHFLAENGYQLENRPIPVLDDQKTAEDQNRRLRRNYEQACEQRDKKQEELDRQKLVRIRLTIAVVALAVAVAGMIFIMVSNDNVGYFNAEEKIQDKYSYWEEQLDAREQELLDWEQELSEQQQQINDSKTQN